MLLILICKNHFNFIDIYIQLFEVFAKVVVEVISEKMQIENKNDKFQWMN